MSMLYGMAVQMMAVERNGEEKVEKTMFFFDLKIFGCLCQLREASLVYV